MRMGVFNQLSGLLMKEIVLSVAVMSVLWLITWVYQRRMFYRRVPSKKLPHSLFMGHALVLEKELRPLPADLHPNMGFVSLVNTHGLWDENIVYIDLSPFVNLSLCLPTNAAGVSAMHNAHLPKSPFLAEYVGRLIGFRGLVLLEGKEWKDMRAMFNPGFSAKETMARLSDMVDEGDIFVELLTKVANGEGFVADMDDMAKHTTFDIIMQATLGVKSHSQTAFHELNDLIRVMGTLPGDATSLNPLHQVNFIKFGKLRYYEWRIKKWLTPLLLARWEEIKQGKGEGRKYILDLALEKRLEERAAASLKPGMLDADYIDLLADVIKGFIFGGHDTTASTLAWCIYELSRNPDSLAKIREEHTAILGPDLSSVSVTMKSSPHIMNKLPYTTAVIKESLRLYPTGSSLQAGPPNTKIIIDGIHYPISNQIVNITHQVLGRNPKYFPSPNAFLPERFLPSPPPEFPPISNDVFRPFHRLPRDCIGQEMAMLEMKMVLVLVARRFEFREAYEELDRRLGRKNQKSVEWAGGRAYMVSEAGNKPKDGIPMWVREVDS